MALSGKALMPFVVYLSTRKTNQGNHAAKEQIDFMVICKLL